MATSTSETKQVSGQVSERDLKLKRFLIEEAKAVGFDAVAFTTPDTIPQAPQRLRQYIADGHHADMLWMEETEDRRANPSVLWPEVRSIMILAMNYGPDSNPLGILEHKDRAAISVYAQNRDYHDIIKGKLKHVASRFAARAGQDVKVFVDTAPVMEKPLAQAAGLGWQGKHTNLVSRELGSWLFLGSIFTTAEIPPDKPDRDHCGSCRACLDACPTKAFPSPYRIDARRCISYLTIENKGPIPHEFRKSMGNRIYGCDDCLSVCPWNKFAQATSEMKLKARDDLKAPRLADFLVLDDPAFRTLFSGSPVKRIGRDRFLRNVLIAAGNSQDPSLLPQIENLLEDPAPVVRGAAVWAFKQLATMERFKISKKRLASSEEDDTVRAEWILEDV
ncbi:tRNA epoxyqueuosine(34) reductase QueG [Brucella pituitosa]|uniref:Epoxyqueuosine reductase n=1 Tax=Brucella pituitosa TaxID=571256 RepID=A0A643F0G5_9HYPH|nr:MULTISPECIES: tRNA epoxyqueuosine(34) reductase QueG [Brucella]PQZ51256.1 tRNA epoxyqueuosine(34) reductase QueG [Ochrobactrum sp. MYb19]PRA65710.1 tRNA epoxyqueuosine(34) reductase QueG [Ochrobactrum sp. MYb18]PRA77400.1 tRNA epoxyqueuosine(34) reductase QueG [Brucella thiophenivorans]PRA87673.1 tRNA epoxyqueuosine(34) reductase QueG [Ochrobactrum sp. MYb29]PRA92965.1 tRNA epoxyqueuosine(34) reductase QueG [Ochrobactrum sp. MYb14]PRA99410.1 tRNA epoxyqueuosine(34) reductase QueG [Ochrobac